MLELTPERLHECLDYCAATGEFTWLSGQRLGRRAGSVKQSGYCIIGVDGADYLAHRLAWFWVNAAWPAPVVDHINGDPLDNRIANLREATTSLNHANKRRAVNNTSGAKGVSPSPTPGKWVANLQANGRQYYLGRFDDVASASAAYAAKAREVFGEFARVA